jgi:hypothetical protein
MWEIFREIKFEEVAPKWAASHIQLPSARITSHGDIEIFYSTRDTDNRSHIVSFFVDRNDVGRVTEKSNNPIVNLGDHGTFDEDGLMMSSVLERGSISYIYYTGFRRCNGTGFTTAIGILVRNNDCGAVYNRFSQGPIIGASVAEPFFTNSPFVFYQNEKFHMIYGSGSGWNQNGEKHEGKYHLRIRESRDGLQWDDPGTDIFEPNNFECATRASTLEQKDGFVLYFCVRGMEEFRGGSNSYKLWQSVYDVNDFKFARKNRVKFTNPEKIEKENMQAYPSTFTVEGVNYLMFNGSDFGKNSIFFARMI